MKKRITMLMAVAALMVAMLAVGAGPASAQGLVGDVNNLTNSATGLANDVNKGATGDVSDLNDTLIGDVNNLSNSVTGLANDALGSSLESLGSAPSIPAGTYTEWGPGKT